MLGAGVPDLTVVATVEQLAEFDDGLGSYSRASEVAVAETDFVIATYAR